jgi:diacylglycerol kinase (ATP)
MVEFVIIANPASGTQAAPWLATRTRELLQAAGKAAELRVTAAAGDARRFAAEAVSQDVPVVAGCGGDGTQQEIATALDGSATALGLLPSGRCNDFARAVGVRTGERPETLVQTLLQGRRRALDLGLYRNLADPAAGEKRFLTVATLGFDSEVSRFVETHKLWLKGTPSYLYGVVRVLLRFKAPLVRLQGDFEPFEGRLLLAATGNAPSYGGAMHITPGAKLDDGIFQVCMVKEVSAFTVLRILPRVLKGTHVHHPAVTLLETRSIEIETPEGPQWVCADGESLGQTPCRLEVKHKALQVLVP